MHLVAFNRQTALRTRARRVQGTLSQHEFSFLAKEDKTGTDNRHEDHEPLSLIEKQTRAASLMKKNMMDLFFDIVLVFKKTFSFSLTRFLVLPLQVRRAGPRLGRQGGKGDNRLESIPSSWL